MKLAQARLVTTDVPTLSRFYENILGITAIGSEDYIEFRGPGSTLTISSKRSMDLFNAGAAEPAPTARSFSIFKSMTWIASAPA